MTQPGERHPHEWHFTQDAHVVWRDIQPPSLLFASGFPTTSPLPGSTGMCTLSTDATLLTMNSAGSCQGVLVGSNTSIKMPQVMLSVAVTHFAVAGPGRQGAEEFISVGIAKDCNNFCVFGYDTTAVNGPTLRIAVSVHGVQCTPFAVRAVAAMQPPFELGFSVVATNVTGWVRHGSPAQKSSSQWTPVGSWCCTGQTPVGSPPLDLRDPAVVNTWTPAIRLSATAAVGQPPSRPVECRLTAFVSGRFGGIAIRDIKVVSNEVGVPDVDADGTGRFLATFVDPSGFGFAGVMRYNLRQKAFVSLDSVLAVEREGKVQLDLAGHVIRDRRSYLFLSTWGNGFGNVLEVWCAEEGMDRASPPVDYCAGAHVIRSFAYLALPSHPGKRYDPHPVRIGNKWIMAYTVTDDTSFRGDPFHAALATIDADCFPRGPWRPVGSPDADNRCREGTHVYPHPDAIGGCYVFNGGRKGLYWYSGDMQEGPMPIAVAHPGIAGGTVTQPWPNAFPWEGHVWIVTFDCTPFGVAAFTWGHMCVYKSLRHNV
jgi:hypothetical protein